MSSRVYWRIHQNFLMRSRLPEYRGLLAQAKQHGYESLTVSELAACASGRATLPPRALILRNDVDSDVSTACAMFEVEKQLGIRATYYFRLATLDAALMRQMQNHGTEVGYHFEEIATVAKRRGFRKSADALRHIDEIREEFRRNILRFKDVAGALPRTLASHGDFANDAIKLTNSCLVDCNVRKEFGIIAETYDQWLNVPVTMRIADSAAPTWWKPASLAQALAQNPSCLYVLVHPRQWRAHPWVNARLDLLRLAEGVLLFARQAAQR